MVISSDELGHLPEFGVVRLGADVVHDVAKLVEKGFNFIMGQQRRQIGCRFGEVAHHHTHGQLASSVGFQAALLKTITTIIPGGCLVFKLKSERLITLMGKTAA